MKLPHIRECQCSECQAFDEAEERYGEWLRALEEEVIEREFGYEPGEFAVYPSHWRGLYEQGLSPLDAWQRALAPQVCQVDK